MDYGTAVLANELAKNRAVHNAVDADPVMVVKYIGSQASGLFGIVAAAEEFTFAHGVSGEEAVDSTIKIGATAGSIDVSNASGNTMGEVVDEINSSANWEARLIGALRSDVPNSSGLSHIASAASAAKSDAGKTVTHDSSVALIMTAGAFNGSYENMIGAEAVDKGEANDIHSIVRVVSNITFASGTNTISIIQVDEATNTETEIMSWAGAATTVEQSKDIFPELGGLTADKGKILKVRATASAAMTAGFVEAQFRTRTY